MNPSKQKKLNMGDQQFWLNQLKKAHERSFPERTTEKEGMTFYQVGRNASHEFYFAENNGKVYRLSIGEGAPIDPYDPCCYEYETDIHLGEVKDISKEYWGHS